MRNILTEAHRRVLRELAWSNALVALDFDGTLAPIVRDPDAAGMRARTRDLLGEVARLYPVVVISGRAQPDVRGRLREIPVKSVVGNHGIEPWHAGDHHAGEVRRWLPALAACASRWPGIEVEDKAYSVAVHYRRSREKKRARAAILEVAGSLGQVRIVGGKQVLNILPHDAPHKGFALERERARLACDTAIYVGDDETDEDVFALDQPGRLLSIRVGKKRSSHAPYFIPDQRAIDALLAELIAYRMEVQRCRQAAR